MQLIVRNQEAIQMQCGYCGVAPGAYCKTSSGAIAYTPHAARVKLFKETHTAVRLLRPVIGTKT